MLAPLVQKDASRPGGRQLAGRNWCELQLRRWSSLMPVTSARLKLETLSLPKLRHCLADGGRDPFLSGRHVRANFHGSPVGQQLLLCGAALSKCFRCRLHSRWATPRQPVRCSGSAMAHMHPLSDVVLSARVTGPSLRPPWSWPTIHGFQVAYASRRS